MHYELFTLIPVFLLQCVYLVKIVKQKVSLEKGNSIHLLTLFPGSPAKLAAKIAGLPTTYKLPLTPSLVHY